MRKRIIFLLLCLCSLYIFTACGKAKNTSSVQKDDRYNVASVEKDDEKVEQPETVKIYKVEDLSEEQYKMYCMILRPISTAFFEYVDTPDKYNQNYFFWYALDHVMTTTEMKEYLDDYYKNLIWITEEPDRPHLTVTREFVEKHAELIFPEFLELPELDEIFIRAGQQEDTFYKGVGSSGDFLQGDLNVWEITSDGSEYVTLSIRETQRGLRIGKIYFEVEENNEENPLAPYRIKGITVEIDGVKTNISTSEILGIN